MKVSFLTFGCRLNQAETAILQNSFVKEGFQIVDSDKNADLVVINTCTVTENGDADTRRAVNRICRKQPTAQIALIGCQAQTQKEELLFNSQVRWIVGNHDKLRLAALVKENQNPRPFVLVSSGDSKSFTIDGVGIDRKHTRANLKIQDGCNYFCAYCEIPYARGRAKSRNFNDIRREANILVEAGHQEIVLTGINLGCYRYRGKTLVDVLKTMEKIDGLKRIRISSVEPTTITDDFIETVSESEKICRFFHIPMQSGDNDILQAMNRKHTIETFSDIIYKIYQAIDDVCLGTDVMVGFPGESEQHFINSKTILSALPLAYLHVFSYSDRQYAKSRMINGKVPKNEINKRSKILRKLGARKRESYLQNFMHKKVTVLFEQKKKGYWSGLTDTYIRVKTESDQNLKNQFRQVKLVKIDKQMMLGTLL
ncbi:tRNA (N(6)-L-threonylcarbamoyladenosine(37)-C(2))-methylthiotransferase MtaB [candidate division KSB1 bacterium]|nr:tRNA (N(6)-L-threonylcarbamoyladenosine(37)-C(2))-methylthiotransferase MtaB [candidate division KSB1 bacterium]